MTATLASPTADEKLDLIAAQLAELSAEVAEMRTRREARDELFATLSTFGPEALAKASAELARLESEGSLTELATLGRTLVGNAAAINQAVETMSSFTRFAEEVAPLAEPAMAALTSRLASLDDKGYFEFVRHAGGVAERVVTSFGEDDIDQLGENVVLILQTVKEMTQPEVMQMLRRTASAVQHQQHEIEAGTDETPSMRQLIRRMRDPEVRRGLARALDMLRYVAAEPEKGDEITKGDG